MTELSWDKDALLGAMSPIVSLAKAELTPEQRAYCRYYQIEFDQELPEVHHYLGYFFALEFKLAMHYYRHPEAKGTVLLMHGYFDHTGLYGHIIRHLLEQGYSVVMYDLPGHGLSSGKPAAIKSFEDYQAVLAECLRFMRLRVPGPWFAVGQSTGGAVLINYLLLKAPARGGSVFRKVVLLAPLVRPYGWRLGRVIHAMVSPFFTYWRRGFSENSGDGRFLKFLREHDPLQSKAMSVDWISAMKRWIPVIEGALPVGDEVIVIQGKKDMTVDWRHNVEVLADKFPHAAFYYIAHGRHHLANETEDIREMYLGWMDEALQKR